MIARLLPVASVFALAVLASGPGLAQTSSLVATEAELDRNVFFMGGPLTEGYFGDAFLFWDSSYESNFFVGAGYQQFVYAHPNGFAFGLEYGVGLRGGEALSAELWGGVVTQYAFELGDFTITPSLTSGFSLVTDTIGSEAARADDMNETGKFLFYLGPEVALSHASTPDLEVFGRIQHRSGGFGTLANLDGANAAVVGLRYSF